MVIEWGTKRSARSFYSQAPKLTASELVLARILKIKAVIEAWKATATTEVSMAQQGLQ